MHEFDFIDQILRPLATHPAAHQLTDDGAVLPPLGSGQEWRITTDTMVEGVHFPSGGACTLAINRLLASNISDLYAQLATPEFYTLNLSLDGTYDLAELGAALAVAQSRFRLSLLGGDTTRTAGPNVLSLTAFGIGQIANNPLRSKAKVGDKIYLLEARHGPLGAAKAGFEGQEAFRVAYEAPMPARPHMDLSVNAMADVSDGILQDLGHICAASRVGAVVNLAALPLAFPDQDALPQITWGDDYALVMTAPERPHMDALIAIGHITAEQGVKLLDAQGKEIGVERPGYVHQGAL